MAKSLELALVVVAAVCCCSLAPWSPAAASQSVAAGPFALNGNTSAAPGSGQVDWDVIYDRRAVAFSSTFVVDYLLGSKREPTSFHQGQSKDTDDIPSWRWTPSLNVPDKDNILDAFGAILTDAASGQVSLFFGLDREAQNGAATVGFWFLQDPNFGLGDPINNIAYAFKGQHMDGDLLIVADFPGQGTGSPANINLYMWSAGSVTQIYTDQNARCDPNNANQIVCAITNDFADIPSPWYYNGKFTQGYTIPARNFFEGGIVVNQLSQVGFSNLPCYSSFLATTRASNSLNAASKDFALGALHQCGLSLQSDCLGGRQVGSVPPYEWNYNVSVTNLGYNDLVDVVIKMNDTILYNISTLKSQETFSDNGTLPSYNSQTTLVFMTQGTGNLVSSALSLCPDPILIPSPSPSPSPSPTDPPAQSPSPSDLPSQSPSPSPSPSPSQLPSPSQSPSPSQLPSPSTPPLPPSSPSSSPSDAPASPSPVPTDAPSPSSSPSPSPPASGVTGGGGSNAGAIAGGVTGGLVGLAGLASLGGLVAGAGYLLYRWVNRTPPLAAPASALDSTEETTTGDNPLFQSANVMHPNDLYDGV